MTKEQLLKYLTAMNRFILQELEECTDLRRETPEAHWDIIDFSRVITEEDLRNVKEGIAEAIRYIEEK